MAAEYQSANVSALIFKLYIKHHSAKQPSGLIPEGRSLTVDIAGLRIAMITPIPYLSESYSSTQGILRLCAQSAV